MTTDNRPSGDLTATASDYGHAYYNDSHLGGHGDYSWESAPWREFFLEVARRIVGLVEPTTVLDVGCAKGLLVQALASVGVDARGSDISDFAIEAAHPDVADRLWVASATEPIEGRYDLITCVEVLEHMSLSDAQKAIDAMCDASDRILFSSTPADFSESTHINVHPTAQWAAWFAERGFYRRTDVDTSFLTAWAILFERDDPTKRTLVEGYESLIAPLRLEVAEKREALLEANRALTAAGGGAGRQVSNDDVSLLARHADLVAIDNVIGLEATVVRLENDLRSARARIKRLRQRTEDLAAELKGMRQSKAWKVGRAATAPFRRFKR